MRFFKSKNIEMFPSSYRGNYTQTLTTIDPNTELSISSKSSFNFDPEAKLNTEFNFTHLSGNLRGKSGESYIIDYKEPKLDGEVFYPGHIKCVIHGYYFEITLDSRDDLPQSDSAYTTFMIGLREIRFNDPNSSYVLGRLTESSPINIDVDATLLDTSNDYLDSLFLGLVALTESERNEAISNRPAYTKQYTLSNGTEINLKSEWYMLRIRDADGQIYQPSLITSGCFGTSTAAQTTDTTVQLGNSLALVQPEGGSDALKITNLVAPTLLTDAVRLEDISLDLNFFNSLYTIEIEEN